MAWQMCVSIAALLLAATCNVGGNILACRSNAAALTGKIAKTLLLPCIIVLTLLLLRELHVRVGDSIPLLLLVGLTLGWIGDLCLLVKTSRMLQIGGTAFGFGHLCYIGLGILLLAGSQPTASTVGTFVTSLAVCFAMFVFAGRAHIMRQLRVDAARARWQEMRAGFVSYALVLCATASMFSALAISLRSPQLGLAAIGGIMFLLSDSLLAVQELRGHSYLRHGALMALYIAGQLCIALGVTFALAG